MKIIKDPIAIIEINNLPWPPSVNHLYGLNRKYGTRYLSQKGRDYHLLVRHRVNDQVSWSKRPLTQRLHLDIYCYPPDDWRRRDLDNILKVMLDSLEHCKVFEDDGQIDRMLVERRTPQAHARVDIRIKEYPKLRLTKRIK